MPKATIYHHDIGDYLKRKEKLEIIKWFGSVTNESIEWTTRSELFSSSPPTSPAAP